jgi:hypothetical protein
MTTAKLVWECQQAICAQSNWNKVMLPWVFGHSRIQGKDDADVLAQQESSSSFLGPKPAIPISPCVGRLMIKGWLTKRHLKYLAATPGLRQSKLFTERHLKKLFMDLLALDKK